MCHSAILELLLVSEYRQVCYEHIDYIALHITLIKAQGHRIEMMYNTL